MKITTTDALNSKDYFESFKRLYYHLYSNSSASRAERIIGDLSKLLLVALAANNTQINSRKLKSFFDGTLTANEALLPILHKEYSEVFSKEDRFHLDEESLRYGLNEIAHLDFRAAHSHALGDAFQALMGPNLRGDKGQFFTPKSVVNCMIEIAAPKGGAKVVDPACGTGGFLTETAAYWRGLKRKSGVLVGIDKDADLFVFASALTKISTPSGVHMNNMNSLDINALKKIKGFASPFDADYVFTNPPFGTKIPIKEKAILSQYELGHHWQYSKDKDVWIKTNELLSSQDPQILFIELCVRLLKNGGILAIVLPEGVFGNTGTRYVLDYLRREGEIFALIDCPRTTFQPGTDTKTNVLFFKKLKNPSQANIKIAVALNCGHDRRGRVVNAGGVEFPNDFAEISKDWKKVPHSFWFDSEITNKYYLVPRYYDRKTDLLLERDAKKLGAKITTLGDMIKKGWVEIRKGHEVGSESYGGGPIPFVRTSDISNFEVSIDPTKSVSEEMYESIKAEQNLAPGDILMVVDGRYRIGRCAILHPYNFKCIAQSHLRIISVTDKAPVSSFELLYLLTLPSVQRDIRSLVYIQSTLGSLGGRIKEIKIPIPVKKNLEFTKLVGTFTGALTERARLLGLLSEFEEAAPEL